MRITICGSMRFAKEMLDIKSKLEKLGYKIFLPNEVEKFVENSDLKNDFKYISNGNFMDKHFNLIKNSDAILVLNYPKKGINGYIGGSTLMEIAIAKYLGKKIFVLNELPNEKDLSYAFEVKITKPVILYNDIRNISSSLKGDSKV
ncbi:hypothetical protein DRH27_02165 [Candidatus Falkowbacteria bacterium]|nr:MAG: hypothetical protein DRH27_02165 [Candidatus Falkowbacteria bacterium]